MRAVAGFTASWTRAPRRAVNPQFFMPSEQIGNSRLPVPANAGLLKVATHAPCVGVAIAGTVRADVSS